MDPISWLVLGGIVVITGATTYILTKNSSTDNMNLKEQINNQIVIQQEKDASMEFAQWMVLCLILIVLLGAGFYWCVQCAVKKAIASRPPMHQNQQNQNVNQNLPQIIV